MDLLCEMDHQFSWELCKFLMFGAISDRENNFLINQSQVHLNRPKTQLQNVGMRYSLGNIYFGKGRNGTVLKNGNDGIASVRYSVLFSTTAFHPNNYRQNFWLFISEVEVEVEVY